MGVHVSMYVHAEARGQRQSPPSINLNLFLFRTSPSLNLELTELSRLAS